MVDHLSNKIERIDIGKVYTNRGKEIKKLPPNVNLGQFADLPEAMSITCNLLNRYMSAVYVHKLLVEHGITNSKSSANVSIRLRKIKKEIGYDEKYIYVPFISTGASSKYLVELENNLQKYESVGPGKKKKGGTLVSYRVDPILGLHALIMEIDSYLEIQGLSFGEVSKTWGIKSNILEKIYKLDNESRNKVDRLAIVQGFDKLAQFITVLDEELHEMLSNDLLPMLNELKNSNNTTKIERIINEIEQNINIKDRYMDYIDTIDVKSGDMDNMTRSEIIE